MVVWKKQGDQYLCVREIYNGDAPAAPAATRSIHLFDMPEGVTEAEWSAALAEMNGVAAELGYPGAGYYMYKTENADTKTTATTSRASGPARGLQKNPRGPGLDSRQRKIWGRCTIRSEPWRFTAG
jgi:hypothetical protein